MSKVSRKVLGDGDFYEVSCAVCADGVSSPAAVFLDELANGLVDEFQVPDMEPIEQIKHRDWILAACERLAECGDLPYQRSYNQLRDGIWEIKRFNIRIALFDTDGLGNYNPKINFDGSSHWGNPPEFPEFDQYIRLANCFLKSPTQHKTPDNQITLAKQIRQEHVNHDK